MNQLNILNRYFKTVIDIKSDQESEQETYAEIKSGSVFKGTNLWIMVFAMIISCIGLNINSKAAIIGAMIMSPLMGPVFGIGFSLGTNDISLLKLSSKNLTRIVIICLTCSTLYYVLNPYHVATDELLSFSSPTLFDILLAFFGGLAGFIAISRRDGNRVLVGVAVATACIPPLCTAGYGIATLQWTYILGGMYTYLLNSVFICLATYMMTRYLNFKRTEYQVKNVTLLFATLTTIMIIPGAFLAYKMGVKNTFKSKADYFISKEISSAYHVIHQEIDAENRTIQVDISTDQFNDELNSSLQYKLLKYPLPNTTLHVQQTCNNQKELEKLREELIAIKKEITQINQR